MEYGFLSILPPLLAVILAIITKETLISLLSGVILGNFILKHGSFIPALKKTLDDLLVQINGNTSVVVFSFLVGAIIILIQVSGGVRGFVIFLTEKSKLVKIYNVAHRCGVDGCKVCLKKQWCAEHALVLWKVERNFGLKSHNM